MAVNNWIKSYKTLNDSFEKKLIFRVGAASGFFSEYNHMVFAIAYCLKHEIKFVLSSKKNNFSVKNGWQDFFLPFCEESNSSLHATYNMRGYQERTTAVNIKAALFKRLLGADFLTQHLWPKFREQEELENIFIPELNLTGSLVENCKTIITNIWHYQPDTAFVIQNRIAELAIPDEYAGVHIRGGDKVTEHKLFSPSDYILKLQEISMCKNVYVATDDYKNVVLLKRSFPDYNFFTNCDENAKGYLHSAFDAQSVNSKKKAMLDLFIDVDILNGANLFIGTYSSNVGMYMGMRRGVNTCYCLDFDEWRIW